MTRNRRPDLETLKSLYLRWLKGESLRKIARTIGIRHQVLDGWFDQTFGKQATDPVANSLVRSMFEDYPGDPVVHLWAAGWAMRGQYETVQHRSKHSIGQLTKFQTMPDDSLMDVIAVSDDKEPCVLPLASLDFLRLPLFLEVSGFVLRTLLELVFMDLARQHRESQGTDKTA